MNIVSKNLMCCISEKIVIEARKHELLQTNVRRTMKHGMVQRITCINGNLYNNLVYKQDKIAS